jgi:Ser/Thr protein kinase RdoA (MazF antagonist)
MSPSAPAPQPLHLKQVVDLWGLDEGLQPLRFVTNHIYVGQCLGEKCVVRLTSAGARSVGQLESELAFARAAQIGGVLTPSPWLRRRKS